MISVVDKLATRALTAALAPPSLPQSRLAEAQERLARAKRQAAVLDSLEQYATPAVVALGSAMALRR